MKHKSIRLCMPALIATTILAGPAQSYVMPGVRPAVQQPLHVAVILTFKDKNIKAAMTKISEAEAVPNKTPEETHMISVVERVIAQAVKGDLRPSLP